MGYSSDPREAPLTAPPRQDQGRSPDRPGRVPWSDRRPRCRDPFLPREKGSRSEMRPAATNPDAGSQESPKHRQPIQPPTEWPAPSRGENARGPESSAHRPTGRNDRGRLPEVSEISTRVRRRHAIPVRLPTVPGDRVAPGPRRHHGWPEGHHARIEQLPGADQPPENQGSRRSPRPLKYGTGCAGSRLLNGTLDIHVASRGSPGDTSSERKHGAGLLDGLWGERRRRSRASSIDTTSRSSTRWTTPRSSTGCRLSLRQVA